VQVIGLWLLFSLPVWTGAYKQAGGSNPEWFGISHVAEVPSPSAEHRLVRSSLA